MSINAKLDSYTQDQIDNNTIRGMYDRGAQHGPITGSGPGFDDAMRRFKRRQAAQKEVGKWRYAPAKWKHDSGTFIDCDWYLIDY